MFAEHQPKLSALGTSSADGFERIATFALVTIRQPLRIACLDYKAVRSGDTRPLFGAKHSGLAYVRAHAGELLDRCESAYHYANDDRTAEDAILYTLLDIPGIGPAKAGFICQMLYGLSGCIDTHNLKRFGIGERTFRGREAGYSEARLRRTISDYNQFCRKAGGCAALWDGWCEYVSKRDPINYSSAELVSRLHTIPLEC